MAVTIKFSEDTIGRAIGNYANKAGAIILLYAGTKAKQMQSYMQVRRRWMDRTGEAKRRLSARVSQPDSNTVRITCSHGVPYGIWLELAHNRRFSIIRETINQFSFQLLDGLNTIFGEWGTKT